MNFEGLRDLALQLGILTTIGVGGFFYILPRKKLMPIIFALIATAGLAAIWVSGVPFFPALVFTCLGTITGFFTAWMPQGLRRLRSRISS